MREAYISLALGKGRYIRFLVKQYNLIGFKDFDLVELAQLSKKQWQNKKFTIPKGYRIKQNRNSNIFEKIPHEEMIKKKVLNTINESQI